METATARSIIDCALEIIYLLSGEDYRVMKMLSGVCVTPIIQLQESITQSPPHSTLCQKKILEITSKITQLVTKEVPLRCQDVALYFSVEEWDYVEGHRDQYLDLVVEEHRILTLPDGVTAQNPPERCPSPLYSQDCPESHQGGDMSIIKLEAEDGQMMEDQPCMSDVKEETRGDDTTENPSKNFNENFKFLRNSKTEGEDIVPPSSEENFITLNVHPEHIPLISCNDSKLEELSPDQSQMAATTHTSLNERRFQCGECGEEFSKNSDLYTHRRRHTGHELYSCSECGISFTDKALLVMHERSHTWENPYSCSKCGKRFSHKSHLVTHEKNHIEIKPYRCAECGKSIERFNAFVQHKKTHTREKPY